MIFKKINLGNYLKFDYETVAVLSGRGECCPKEISSLISRSGVLIANITDKYNHRAVSGDMSYLRFTEIYPNQENKELEICGARCFMNFVYGFLSYVI